MGSTGTEKLNAAIQTIAKATLNAGRISGIFRPSADDIGNWTQSGLRLFILASDTMLLGAGVAAAMKAAREVEWPEG